jgi:hypothetical protein
MVGANRVTAKENVKPSDLARATREMTINYFRRAQSAANITIAAY